MKKRAEDFLTGDGTPSPALPPYVSLFAKAASGGSGDGDEDDDEEEDDDEDEDDEDDLADLSEEELRAELKKTRESLSKASGSSKTKRDKIKRLNRELEEARKPKPKAKAKDGEEEVDLDAVRETARREGETAGLTRAKRAEARAALLSSGVNPARVAKAVGLLDLDELDLDDDGLDGVDDAIDELRGEWPELFARPRRKRESVAGKGDRDGESARRPKAKTASEQAAEKLLHRG